MLVPRQISNKDFRVNYGSVCVCVGGGGGGGGGREERYLLMDRVFN